MIECWIYNGPGHMHSAASNMAMLTTIWPPVDFMEGTGLLTEVTDLTGETL